MPFTSGTRSKTFSPSASRHCPSRTSGSVRWISSCLSTNASPTPSGTLLTCLWPSSQSVALSRGSLLGTGRFER